MLFFESIKRDRCISDDGVCDGASLRALLPLSIVASEIPCLAPLLLAVLFIARVDAPARGIPEDRLALLRKAFQDLKNDKTFQRLMSRLGEGTDIIDGAEYEKIRVKQSKDYKELVESLANG